MPRKKEVTQPTPIELMLARSLFRSDKWDPDRDAALPFEWEEQRSLYIRRANRLLRTFEKDGLKLSEVAAWPAATSVAQGMPS